MLATAFVAAGVLGAPQAAAQAVTVPATATKPARTVYIFWGCGVRKTLSPDERKAIEEQLPNAPSAPIVDGRYYRQCTAREDFAFFRGEALSFRALVFPAISAAIGTGTGSPSGWGQDFPGFMQRFGSAYGQEAIRATTRYGLAAILHEDVYYRICHRCTVGDKMENAFLGEFSARHGEDGHRMFSVTPIVSSLSGSLVAESAWYPQGYGYGPANAAKRGIINVPIRIGINMLREFVFDRDTKIEKQARKDAADASKP